MRKISKRAFSVLLISFAVIAGLAFFIWQEYEDGEFWANYFSLYNSGSEGRIVDRNGVELAYFNGADSTYSENAATRTANYHVTGDYIGRTATGLLKEYWKSSQNYSFVAGVTKTTSSVLELNIDSAINNKAYELLRANGKGCIMICNYRTNEVLCMVSSPSVDPLDTESEPEDGAYINRCLSAAFIPGSTFKLITAAAAIENIPDLDERTFMCYGEEKIAGVPITCTTMHGEQTFEEALANSCNCAFAEITVELGQDTMVKYVNDYGFLSRHAIDGITTAAGNYPTEFVGDPELGWSGIGQSTDLVNPYQMLRYVCAIANGGSVIEPELMKGVEPVSTPLISEATTLKMQKLMRNNVITHYEGEVNFPGLELCAKTGTAENGDGTSHSWFVGFLQDEAHPYAFVSLVENGGFGLWTSGLMMNELLQFIVN